MTIDFFLNGVLDPVLEAVMGNARRARVRKIPGTIQRSKSERPI